MGVLVSAAATLFDISPFFPRPNPLSATESELQKIFIERYRNEFWQRFIRFLLFARG
jgi:hypothetical protein